MTPQDKGLESVGQPVSNPSCSSFQVGTQNDIK